MSPTARTLALLRKEGFTADVCERRLPLPGFVTVDLFHAFDVVAVRADVIGVLGAQCTSGSNHSARVRKLQANPVLRTWIAAGNRAEIWSWSKRGGRWTVRRQQLLGVDLAAVELTPRPPRRKRATLQHELFD